MAEPSKILTVSYGTFSCTLEGFDDAFETMKSIAEYFRDLAAEDRYFGAEPPTPDPEMLARIAERDIERRVEARLSDSGYVLRPAALADAAAAASDTSVADIDDSTPVEGPAAEVDTAPAPDVEEAAAATPDIETDLSTDESESAEDTADLLADAAAEEVEEPAEIDDTASDASEPTEEGEPSDDVADRVVEDAAEIGDAAKAPEPAEIAEHQEPAEIVAEADVDTSDEAGAGPETETSEQTTEAETVAEPQTAAEETDETTAESDEATEEPDEAVAESYEAVAESDEATEEPDEATAEPQEASKEPEESASEDIDADADAAQTDDVPEGYDPLADKRPWSELTMTERRLRRQARRDRRAEQEAKAAEDAANAPKPAALTEARDPNERRGLIGRFSNAGKTAAAAAAAAAAGSVTTEALRGTETPAAAEDDKSVTARGTGPDMDDAPLDDVAVDAAPAPEPSAQSDTDEPEDIAVDAAAAPTAPVSAGESVAAKLARIRAVVGGKASEPTIETQEQAELEEPTTEGVAAEETPDDASDDSVFAPSPDSTSEAEEWSIAQSASDTGAEATLDAAHDTSDKDEADTEDAASADAGADAEAAQSQEAEEGAEDAPGPSRVRARVVRMRRSDYDAQTVEAGEQSVAGPSSDESALETLAEAEDQPDLERLDGVSDTAELTDGGLEGAPSTLSPEDEAALLEELAEVERLASTEEGDTGEDPSEPSGRAALLARSPDADTDGVDRILTETDAQLQEPEGNRRREAIAHLKAAVAATEAARQLGEEDGLDDGENMFREDLDQVVRPRRTTRIEHRSDRPRPAPLKLVASQRVDAATEAQQSDPVTPRRVQVGAEAGTPGAAAESHDAFARFAADMGATGLADMLEAAAAHAAFVEGEEDVSRPQLMKMVSSSMPGGFSREDGLRAFGTLLRQGRIEKVRNGRFRISPQSRFNPQRAASGV